MGGAADMMGPGVETDVDLEIARTLWKNHKLIPPQSVFKARWDVMMIVFVMYNCVFIPFELCFAYDKHLIHAIFDYIIDVMFLIDMILSFRTTYYNTGAAAPPKHLVPLRSGPAPHTRTHTPLSSLRRRE